MTSSRRRRPFFIAAAALAAGAWFLSPLPDVIASALVDAIPIEEDIALGAFAVQSAGYWLQDGCRPGRRCVDDIGRDVLHALVKHIPELSPIVKAYDWHFGVTQQTFINAFAYPGGRIFVTRGLLDATTDDEVAAVIGHEVGHVLHRHSQKRAVQQNLGRLLLDALLFGDGDAQAESFGSELGGLLHGYASQLSTMSYSRANEYEADHVGFLACAGMSSGCQSGSLSSFFRKLDGGGGATAWHSTHPGSRDRIATLDRLQDDYRLARRTGRHNGRDVASSSALAEFAPASLKGGSGSGLLGLAGSAWSLLPSGTQRAVFLGALWQAAAGLEWAWQQFEHEYASQEAPPSRRQPAQPARRHRDWAQPRYQPVD